MSTEPTTAAEPIEAVTPTAPRASGPVRLTFDGDAVTVRPADAGRYLRYARRAFARGRRPAQYGGNPCPAKPGTPEATAAFESGVLIPLRDWCRANADRVAACYGTLVRAAPRFHLVTNRVPYDFELGRKLSDWNLAAFDTGWAVLTVQVPRIDGPDDLSPLFDPDRAVVFDADR